MIRAIEDKHKPFSDSKEANFKKTRELESVLRNPDARSIYINFQISFISTFPGKSTYSDLYFARDGKLRTYSVGKPKN